MPEEGLWQSLSSRPKPLRKSFESIQLLLSSLKMKQLMQITFDFSELAFGKRNTRLVMIAHLESTDHKCEMRRNVRRAYIFYASIIISPCLLGKRMRTDGSSTIALKVINMD